MKRVLLLMPSEKHFGMQMIQGVADYMQLNESWQLVVPGERGWPWKIGLDEWRGEGVILPIISPDTITRLNEIQMPYVNITAYPTLPTVQNDNVAMGRLAVEHFLAQGFRNFCWFPSKHTIFGKERLQGFAETLAERGLTPRVFNGEFDPPSIQAFLDTLPLPCAVQLCMDIHSKQIYTAAEELDLSIPDQLAVMGMDDDILGLTLSPPLSTVQPDGRRVGFEAARALQNLFDGLPAPASPLLIPPLGIAARKSSSSFGFKDPMVARALAYIRARAKQGMLVEEVVEEVNLSRRNLERRFKREVGHSIWREMRRVQIEHVKNLLRSTSQPVKAIAAESAFPEPARLSQVFREETGETPATYRKRHQS